MEIKIMKHIVDNWNELLLKIYGGWSATGSVIQISTPQNKLVNENNCVGINLVSLHNTTDSYLFSSCYVQLLNTARLLVK